VSYVRAAQDLGVHQSVLRNWVKAFADDPSRAAVVYEILQ
jgi:transposase-like protein